MPERVPAGEATNPGQPIAGNGNPVVEQERVPNGRGLNPPVAYVGVGAPVLE